MEAYNIQEDTTYYGKISTASEMVVKAKYLNFMQKKWYWEQKNQQQAIVFPTLTIVHQFLDIVLFKDDYNIPRSFCNKKSRQALQRYRIFLIDSDSDYIIYKIVCRLKM